MNIYLRSYAPNDSELNLYTMFKQTVQKAFDKHPNYTIDAIAQTLGISERTLYTMKKEWGIKTNGI